MRVIMHLIRKEFLQIMKDKPMLGIIFIMPLVQLFVLGYAITTDIKDVAISILDQDQTPESRAVIASVMQSGRFVAVPVESRIQDIRRSLFNGHAQLALVIPPGFARDLIAGLPADIQLIIDGVDSNTALVGSGYARSSILQYAATLSPVLLPGNVRVRALYNPELESTFGIIPGIIALLLTIVTMMLTALGLVREREIGTLEQLNVTPIRPIQLVIGKILPFAILGGLMFALSLAVAMAWFRIPMRGSVFTLTVMAAIYLLTTLGLGIFISTATSTQQQAIFLAWFILVMSILMSGFMFPISNMPEALQMITYLIPLRYFITALRDILLKGATLADLSFQWEALLILGGSIFIFSILNFRKQV
ncbi:ABC transporter permease [bacterium]|nr:ABC transporter permease [candidate division CSSED10-310 bacterium]